MLLLVSDHVYLVCLSCLRPLRPLMYCLFLLEFLFPTPPYSPHNASCVFIPRLIEVFRGRSTSCCVYYLEIRFGQEVFGKIFGPEDMKSVRNLGYYVMRNVAISTDQAVM